MSNEKKQNQEPSILSLIQEKIPAGFEIPPFDEENPPEKLVAEKVIRYKNGFGIESRYITIKKVKEKWKIQVD